MKDASPVRVWSLLVRMRQLRVERVRRQLREARSAAEHAGANTAARKQAITEHDLRRRTILAACACGDARASLWRMALVRHDSEKFALETALVAARDAETRAQKHVVSVLHALQREMRGLDFARERVRRLLAAQDDDSGIDD